MAIYVKPANDATRVNAAGRAIAQAAEGDESPEDKDVIDNFRAAHQYPLNSFTMTVKNRASSLQRYPLVAQRVKRFASIKAKLTANQDMKLSQMQDIGGCRAVLNNVELVRELRDLYVARPLTHQYIGIKDYIDNPKSTGYRSVHLKYRCVGRGKNVAWGGMKIEIQLRTKLQHMWATAVEAAGTFTNAALKSNAGSADWLRFFALMSSVIALRENCRIVPGTPALLDDLVEEIRQLDRGHHILRAFEQYSAIIPTIEGSRDAAYFLVTLNPLEKEVQVEGFKKPETEAANRAYSLAERRLQKGSLTQVVLVSVSSVNALRQAYPNYFLDTQAFLGEVTTLLR